MLALAVVVFLSLMSFGIFSWYIFVWNLTIRHESILTAAVQIQPLTVGAVLAAALAAFLIPRISAQYILAIGATAMLIANILLATMPAQQNYWRTEFVALAFAAFCPDLVFTAAQIIASNSVKRREQGIAGSLVGTLFTYGISTGLGFGGTVDMQLHRGGQDPVRGYRGALFLGVGFAAASLVLGLLFVRIDKDQREGWDEKETSPEDSEASGISSHVIPDILGACTEPSSLSPFFVPDDGQKNEGQSEHEGRSDESRMSASSTLASPRTFSTFTAPNSPSAFLASEDGKDDGRVEWGMKKTFVANSETSGSLTLASPPTLSTLTAINSPSPSFVLENDEMRDEKKDMTEDKEKPELKVDTSESTTPADPDALKPLTTSDCSSVLSIIENGDKKV